MRENDCEQVWLCEKLDNRKSMQRKIALQEKLRNSDYGDYSECMLSLLMEFSDMIGFKGDKLGITNVLKYKIVLEKGTKPIYIPAYRIPMNIKGEVEKTVQGWESEGVIRKSSSPFNFLHLQCQRKTNHIGYV